MNANNDARKIRRKEILRKAYEKYRKNNPDKVRKNQRESHKRIRLRDLDLARLKKRILAERYKDKSKAVAKLNWAIKSGKIVRPNKCERCNIACKAQGHHTDYNKPYEVIRVSIKEIKK